MIERLDHEHIFVKDFEKNLKFLTETMNFPIIGTPIDKNLNLRMLKIGDDTAELVDMKQFRMQAKCAFLVDNIEKEINSMKEKGIVIAESTEIAVAKWKEGWKIRYILLRMVGEEKFDGDWIELVEKI